jgi:hypothetical protein
MTHYLPGHAASGGNWIRKCFTLTMEVFGVPSFSMLAWQLADGFHFSSQLATTKTRGTPELLSFAIFSGASVRRVLCRLKVTIIAPDLSPSTRA